MIFEERKDVLLAKLEVVRLLPFSGRYTSGGLCLVLVDCGNYLALSEISSPPGKQDRELGSLIANLPCFRRISEGYSRITAIEKGVLSYRPWFGLVKDVEFSDGPIFSLYIRCYI